MGDALLLFLAAEPVVGRGPVFNDYLSACCRLLLDGRDMRRNVGSGGKMWERWPLPGSPQAHLQMASSVINAVMIKAKGQADLKNISLFCHVKNICLLPYFALCLLAAVYDEYREGEV